MVGRPVARMVWSRTAGSMAKTRAMNASRTPPDVGPEPILSACVLCLIVHLQLGPVVISGEISSATLVSVA